MASFKTFTLSMLILANYFWYWSRSEPIEKKSMKTFTLGALLSSGRMKNIFNESVTEVNRQLQLENITVAFLPQAQIMAASALPAAQQVCDLLSANNGTLFALVVSHPPHYSTLPPLSPSFTCAFYDLPVIGVTVRQSAFSDKYSHTSFLRTVPPYSQEASAWADLIRQFQWREVTFIHSDDQEGKTLLSGLERASEGGSHFKIFRNVPFDADEDEDDSLNFTKVLDPVQKEQTRALILYAKRDQAERIFAAAKKLGLLSREWSWIVTEQALTVSNPPQGIIGVRLSMSDEAEHIRDAVNVITRGILNVYHKNQSIMRMLLAPSSCDLAPSDVVTVDQPVSKSPLVSNTKSPRANVHKWSDYGQMIYKEMINVELPNGQTGFVKFDNKGDRVLPKYDIINIQFVSNTSETTHAVNVGTYGVPREIPPNWDPKLPFMTHLNIDMWKLRWPGNYTANRTVNVCIRPSEDGKACLESTQQVLPTAPPSFKKKTLLKVVTKVSIPFVYARSANPKCDVENNSRILGKEVPCTHTKPNTDPPEITHFCCSGYCIDLLRRLARPIEPESGSTGGEVEPKFAYELHLVGDDEIGQEKQTEMTSARDADSAGGSGGKDSSEGGAGGGGGGHLEGERPDKNDNGDSNTRNSGIEGTNKQWTGIVGELLRGEADLAVAPMTITPERAARIEFTKPFKYLGLSILVRRGQLKSNLASFLQPFEDTLWVLVGLSVHVVALVLYLLDRFSPFGRFKLAKNSDTEEDALNLSSAMWFAWGVLLNSGIGEGTPRSFSARVLGMVWAGFAMIIVASYTANLAAFLVLDRPDAVISGIDDPRLRNPQDDFTFATVRGSPVEMYFKRQVEYATMFRTMEQRNYKSAEDAIEAVKNEKLHAFIWDSARLNFEASRECNLITAGETFGRTGYGLAMKKENPWLYEMSQSVLNFHERGFMETLDAQWILTKNKNCLRTQSSPATLGLTNMAGVFIMVAGGIIVGIFLIFIEIIYKRRRGMKERELELAKNAADRWRGIVEKRKILRKTHNLQRNGDADIHDATSVTQIASKTHCLETEEAICSEDLGILPSEPSVVNETTNSPTLTTKPANNVLPTTGRTNTVPMSDVVNSSAPSFPVGPIRYHFEESV